MLLTLVGVLAGVVVLQVARNRELRRRLDERRAEESVEVDWEEAGEHPWLRRLSLASTCIVR